MKTSVKAGLFFALIWMISILVAFLAGYSVDYFLISELFSLLLLLGAIFTGLYLTKKENDYERVPALEDFKIAMQSGLVYAILATVFVYVYHNNIDPSVKKSFQNQRIEMLHEQYPDEASFAELQTQTDTWDGKSFDDFIENQEHQIESFIGDFFTSFFHLLIYFMFSLFYSFFVMIVLRKIVLRH